MSYSSEEAFHIINNSEHSPRLISIFDFSEEEGAILFNLRRVCRLTHSYAFYLFKLYLEYRGRQPYQSINLVRLHDVSYAVYYKNVPTEHYCTIQLVEDPISDKPKKWRWKITRDEIEKISELLELGKPKCENEYIIIGDESYFLDLPDSRRIIIKKGEKRIKIDLE